MKRTLNIDLETYSPVNLKDCGLYRYAADPDFEILLFAYCFDDGPVTCIDLSNFEGLPMQVIEALWDKDVLKTAHNAPFEIVCLNAYLKAHGERKNLDISQWECTSVKSAMVGLPMSLDAIPKALNMEQQKDREGKALINYFCVPCKPTKANGMRTRNYPEHAPEKWQRFKEYNINDVLTERAIRKRISFFTIPESEKVLWQLDQKINGYGVRIDRDYVNNAVHLFEEYKNRIVKEAIQITGVNNPNSLPQLKKWLSDEMGAEVVKLNKESMPELLKSTDSPAVKRLLQIRKELGKSSVTKYYAMQDSAGTDDRIRGTLQFYGAGRTGRWAGRLTQVHNLPKNTEAVFGKDMACIGLARNTAGAGDLDGLDMLFGNIPNTLSQLVRTAFIPAPGHRFIVADFAAIEARVTAWVAGEKWRLDVFNGHGKIYEASASKMFKVPLESIGKKSPLRDKGKVSELALGYQGGWMALIAMGALEMGIVNHIFKKHNIEFCGRDMKLYPPEFAADVKAELDTIVKLWRHESPSVVKSWYALQDAALEAIYEPGSKVPFRFGVSFEVKNDCLFMYLPSGRKLTYQSPRIVEGKYGDAIQYMGMDQVKKIWKKIDTYGGKLFENLVQAIARDCLSLAMQSVDKAGYRIVMHVHDEVILEVPENWGDTIEVDKIMSAEVPWAKGLPLTAESSIMYFYMKD